ncbi:hypothetical protein ElyMa_003190800 [Elysia marginata]|uniref:Uncharacterized protein n=1 Tax=Elysia marginata TaxID=1093978 RepID=A0AAV4IYR5_9GAST|nr:hypothetical protein ElyMa_003190800 [Elysia marginata]
MTNGLLCQQAVDRMSYKTDNLCRMARFSGFSGTLYLAIGDIRRQRRSKSKKNPLSKCFNFGCHFSTLSISHKHFLNPWGKSLTHCRLGRSGFPVWNSTGSLPTQEALPMWPHFYSSVRLSSVSGAPATAFVVDKPAILLASQPLGALQAKAAEVIWGKAGRKITLDLLVLYRTETAIFL